ncbi:prolyl oligopeptidase [Chytriomyces cf. hyalinus JEL632]|nr:prolyl oligopeptidase [Chytriomyces cf. hyalinus JEL632]
MKSFSAQTFAKRMMSKFIYPAVRRDESHVDVLHGVPVKDPFRHLEDPDAAETKAFVEAQNALFQSFIKESPVRAKLEARLTKMFNYERYGVPFKKGSSYYYFHNSGLQPQSVLYTQKSIDSEASVFFDPNKLSEDGTVSLGSYKFSESGNLFAYALSASGSDWVKIHVKQVGAEKDLEDKPLEWAKFTSMTFTHDEKGFFYNRYPTPSVSQDKAGTETDSSVNQMVYYHRIGTDQSEDLLIYSDPENPTRMFGVSVSDCGRYLILNVSESCDPKNLVYVADLEAQFGCNSCLGVPKFSPIVSKWEAEFSWIATEGTVIFFETTLNAPKKRIVKYDIANPSLGFVEVVAETENPLDFNNVVDKDKLVLVYLKDVKHVMKVYNLTTGAFLNDIDMPSGSIIKGMSGTKKDNEMFYSYASFVSPGVIRRYDFSSPSDSLFRETTVSGFDSSIFEVKQVVYASEDGTKIPMYIIHKKSTVLNGENPTLLYAYGGFNISILPAFSVSWLTFVEKFNGVVAVANIRGGAEYGQEWYNAGRLFKKQNCFTDFQYAAKYLISANYTNPRKIVINGGSNGGLLVGACLNQAPDLFGLGVAEVGVMDLLRFHKFTIGSAWTSDYGNPDVKEDFEYAVKISPLHNVPTEGSYPAVLIITGDHDDRVVPLHSMKLAATMQHNLAHSENPIMMRINTKAGHGAGKSMQQVIEEASDKYTYISIVLDAPYVE